MDVFDYGEWIMIPSDLVAKAERDRTYRIREAQRKAKRAWKPGYVPYKDRLFLAWDGEGYNDRRGNHHYMLLANSEGQTIASKSLSTVDCLRTILYAGKRYPNRIHVWFGGNYDASMILGDLPQRFMRILKMFNSVTWNGFQVDHVPHKWFRVWGEGIDVKIYDVQSFFACSFEKALTDWKVGPWSLIAGAREIVSPKRSRVPSMRQINSMSEIEIVRTFKKLRGNFGWRDIRQVTAYNRIELKYLVLLCERLRETFSNAGFDLHSWHGPGALARLALNRHHVSMAMATAPISVRIAALYAFAGGRFEMPRGGHLQQKIYNADINSAYPYYATMLPNLSHGKWRQGNKYEPGKFAVYHIEYRASPSLDKIYPLFRRTPDGYVEWSNRVEGWYWNPEAELVANDPNATFLDAWIFDEDDPTDRPFAWIAEYYRKRQVLKQLGNAAEFTFKLCINSVYGQLAQRTGWDKKNKKAPRYHQLEWAGWITSACRAAVTKVAMECGDKLISIDTDGIYALCPIPVTNIGSALGQWDISEYQSGVFWQSGIYALRSGDTWQKAKTRGIPKGTYEPEQLIQALQTDQPLRMSKKSFIGYGLATNGRWDQLNTWQLEPHEFVFGGQGKRAHNTVGCANGKTCGNGIHLFMPVCHRLTPNDTVMSQPHYLPWLDNSEELRQLKEAHIDAVLFDANDDDPEERWIIDRCRQLA